MKWSKISKTFAENEITEEQLEQISRFTRRKMMAEELYVFALVLCDNEVDRDLERFSENSLGKLAELFVGKTGIFDHNATTKNQSARIFSTKVTKNGSLTSLEEDYLALTAFAYMVRSEKNADLILEIDGGIKKEVSVGCAVEQVLCSVCSSDQKKGKCSHKKGEVYNGVPCHHVLENPVDAYEWSFVAVPAQKNAGVTKEFLVEGSGLGKDTIGKLYGGKEARLTKGEISGILRFLERSQELISAGKSYEDELRQNIIKNAAKTQPHMDFVVLEEVCKTMTHSQLKAFNQSYEREALKQVPLYLQLGQREQKEHSSVHNDFKI